MEEVLQGTEGVRNISGNIIVFGESLADQDAALQAVFQKMRENNLTANPAKCLFNQSSIDFFGHHFSADGSNASPPKMQLKLAVSSVLHNTSHVS